MHYTFTVPINNSFLKMPRDSQRVFRFKLGQKFRIKFSQRLLVDRPSVRISTLRLKVFEFQPKVDVGFPEFVDGVEKYAAPIIGVCQLTNHEAVIRFGMRSV